MTDGLSSVAPSRHGLSIVTVVFSAELPLLELQARSLALYVDATIVDEILVIANGAEQDAVAKHLKSVAASYGPLQAKLRVLRASEVIDFDAAIPGWFSQQALKLEASAYVRSPSYLVLDAKNHFISKVEIEDLIASDGRLLSLRCDCSNLRLLYENSVRITEVLDPPPATDSLAGFTPIMLHTETARGLVAFLGARGTSVQKAVFAGDASGMDFFLYFGFSLHAGTFDKFHVRGPRLVETLWPDQMRTKTGFADALSAVADGRAKAFSVHRTSFALLSQLQRDAVGELWLARGLFRDRVDVRAFFARQARTARRRRWEKRLASVRAIISRRRPP